MTSIPLLSCIVYALVQYLKEGMNYTMKKALVVGLNKYPECSLDWCDSDAIAMATIL